MGVERMIADQEKQKAFTTKDTKDHKGKQATTPPSVVGLKPKPISLISKRPVVSLYFPDPWIIRANPR
jgi:hypothetical protein